MKLLWTLLKVALVLVIGIPVAIVVLATALGLFGALFGIAVLVLRFALVGLIAYGAFRLIARLIRGPAPSAPVHDTPRLAPVDRHYEAAMRELDSEFRADKR